MSTSAELLDPLGDDRRVDALRKRDQPGGQRLTGAIALDPVDERPVELDEVRCETKDVAKAREPGAGVVDGQAHAQHA